MRKKYIYLLTGAIIMTIIVIYGVFAYAWLSRQSRQLTELDGNSGGAKFSYTINEGSVNQENYAITGLSFFDIDSEAETEDFLSMSFVLEIELNNTGPIGINYEISQNLAGIDTEVDPYILCIFSDTEITDTTSYSTISDIIASGNTLTGSLGAYSTSATTDSTTFYVYVIGAQPDDGAENSFLGSTFEFMLSISATQTSS